MAVIYWFGLRQINVTENFERAVISHNCYQVTFNPASMF
jgi:hypothetical protein